MKVEWQLVLEPEILHNEKQHPDLPVRDMYRWVIDDLNKNRIRSRVIMSIDKVIGYAFLYPATGFSDRNFASFGFIDPVTANRERSFILLDWAITECRKDGRKLLFNEPFNAGNTFHACMDERGIRILHRVEMSLDPKEFVDQKKELPNGYSTMLSMSADPAALAEALYLAFKGEDESVLISDEPAERKRVEADALSGKLFGLVISEASIAVTHNGRIVAGITVVTNDKAPLILDFFVIPDEQDKGIGSFLMQISMKALSRYSIVKLWTDQRSIAHDFYMRRGFQDTGRSEILYYFRPGKQQEQLGKTVQ
ncbi:MAG: GNAT family N-acetyltransferase [Thermoplasmata archaeon]